MIDTSLTFDEARDIDTFLEDPVGHYLRRPGFTYWYPRAGLTGFGLFGCPNEHEIKELNRVMDVVLAPRADAHMSIVDASRLTGVELDAFVAMSAYLARRQEAFRNLIQRQALIRPSGLIGATVAGFYAVTPAKYPVKIFDNLADGMAWLEVPQSQHLAATLTSLCQAGNAVDRVLLELRSYLRSNLTPVTLARAADRMHMTERTLQRKLERCGTCFQTEVNASRIWLAKRLMLQGRASLSEISRKVHCHSPQHFSAMFRKVTGEAPSSWRDRQSGSGLARRRTALEGTDPRGDDPS
jgi:AraC-like DNA-binding protein